MSPDWLAVWGSDRDANPSSFDGSGADNGKALIPDYFARAFNARNSLL